MHPSLLEDIQAAAIDGDSDLGTILRKCKVFAARLDSKPLEDWLLWEANGYPDEVDVPAYRVWELSLKGNFSGSFGSALTNAPVPLVCLPEHHRHHYESHKCRRSVAALESLLKTGGTKFNLSTGDLNVILGGKVYANLNCLQVWAEIASGQIFEVLNTVRNRILDFTLAVWKECPTAGELGSQDQGRLSSAQVTQIFYTTVYDGGSATVVGSASNSSIGANVLQGDLVSLNDALAKQGLSAEELHELSSALKEDNTPTSKDKLGPQVSAWFGRMAMKAAEGTLKAGGTLALKTVSDAIMHYYGLKPLL